MRFARTIAPTSVLPLLALAGTLFASSVAGQTAKVAIVAAPVQLVPPSEAYNVQWDQALVDRGGWWTVSGRPDALRVPNGVRVIEATATLKVDDVGANLVGECSLRVQMRINDAGYDVQNRLRVRNAASGDTSLTFHSGPVTVVPGDTLTLRFRHDCAGDARIDGLQHSGFSVRAIY